MSSASSELIELGHGERRVAADVEIEALVTVAGDDWLEHLTPALGAVHVTGPERAPLEVPELVEHEQRVSN
jgi:hypothetical protein